MCSSIILTVMMGVSYSFFNNEMIIYSPKLNYKILYGFGIGIGILCFIGFSIFLLAPSLKVVSFIVFPAFFLFSLIILFVNIPHSAEKFVDNWNNVWKESLETEIFQMKQKCCGWFNESDRGLEICPMNFIPGCSNVLQNYLKPRFKEIFVAMIVILSLGLISTFVLFAIYSSEKKLITALPIFT